VNPVRSAFLEAATSAARLLAEPAVAAAWERPSALAKLSVSGLAGHLLNQIVVPGELLRSGARPVDSPVSILEHYARTARTDVDVDDEPNVSMRRDGADRAASGAPGCVRRRPAGRGSRRRGRPAAGAARRGGRG